MNTESKVLQIPVEDIIPNRFQPRLAFDNDSLQELASSIKEHGIIQPLVLRRTGEKYEIIAGERRYKAAQIAGLTSVPAILSNLTDNESAEVAIVENVQRKDLTAIEEAKSYKSLLDKGYLTQEELARKMGLSQSAISNKLRLLTLDEEVQNAILTNKISERHARSLLKVNSKDDQKILLKRIIDERLTVKQLEQEIKKLIGDLPLIKNRLNIEEIQNKAEDLKIEPIETISIENEVTNVPNMPTEVPNKFFNFLEDYSANMNTNLPDPEPIDIFNIEPEKEQIKENESDIMLEDGIELLDETIISVPKEAKKYDKINEIITKIKNILKDETDIILNERDSKDEYQINITIRKKED